MHSTASQYFGQMAEEYDSLVRRAIPRYAEMIGRILDYAPESAQRILELGCGTGNLTVALAEHYPEADLTLVDGSAEMLAATSARLPQRECTLVEARFEEMPLEPRTYDLVTSCISLHHVEDKRALFSRIREVLTPGGWFVFGDQMGGSTERNHQINWNRMLAFWKRPGHCTEAEAESLIEHAEAHDHYESIVDQIRWLEEAGFEEIDCVWRSWMWGVLTARR